MGDKSAIQWTDATWNVVTGCTKVSAGCKNCYAEKMAVRLQCMGSPRYRDGFAPRFHRDSLNIPLRWKRPRRIFTNSMSDLFHDDITNEQITAVFGVMAACPQHTFQVLTKRPSRMLQWFQWADCAALDRCACAADDTLESYLPRDRRAIAFAPGRGTKTWPLPNVWLGVSVENQAAADERIPLLLQTPAVVHWVSAEPLLGPIDMRKFLCFGTLCECDGRSPKSTRCTEAVTRCNLGLHRVNWVVAGCESGPGARPMNEDWVRSLRDQCDSAWPVPFFFKQAMREGKLIKMPELDGRVWDQMPEGG